MPVVVDNASFAYAADSPPALECASVTIGDGEFVGIVGRTGSGKSTLVQLIAGLVRPTSGMVLVDGKDINASSYDRRELRRLLGIVFQYPETQLFEQTVYADVEFGLRPHMPSKEERRERARWALRTLGFDPDAVGDKSPLGFSGGEKRRIAIAGVIAIQPRVLILDEPVAGLDPLGRRMFMQLLDDLNAQGTTIVMVSHNADCLAEHAQRIIALDEGRVVLDASVERAYGQGELLAHGIGACQVRVVAGPLEERGLVPAGIVRYDDLVDQLVTRLAGREAC